MPTRTPKRLTCRICGLDADQFAQDHRGYYCLTHWRALTPEQQGRAPSAEHLAAIAKRDAQRARDAKRAARNMQGALV